jgi:hypothetical protein
MERKAEEEDRHLLGSALVAAVIVNVNRVKGARIVQPSDFIIKRKRPGEEEPRMTVQEAEAMFKAWADSINRSQPQSRPRPS